jgi:hypothetical protein
MGEITPAQISTIFRDLCLQKDSGDGLTFDPDAIKVTRIAERQKYPGLRVEMRAGLAAAIISVQVDIGFGDAITPGPVEIVYPTLLGHEAPQLKAYPQETVIAEKLHAMVQLGMTNSRVRDFHDLWMLAQIFNFEGPIVAAAIHATFRRRQMQIPVDVPASLSTEFETDDRKKADWLSFLHRTGKDKNPPALSEVCSLLRTFLMPPCQAVAAGKPFKATWMAPGPWRG